MKEGDFNPAMVSVLDIFPPGQLSQSNPKNHEQVFVFHVSSAFDNTSSHFTSLVILAHARYKLFLFTITPTVLAWVTRGLPWHKRGTTIFPLPSGLIMSVKHAISRGLELGRSALQLGLLKSGGRFAAKLRADRLRVAPSGRAVQPQAFLPSRYRYYRTSLKGLAARLQSAGFGRRLGGGSPRNRAAFWAFGLGVGLIEQQLDDDRRSAATCDEIQVWRPLTIKYNNSIMLHWCEFHFLIFQNCTNSNTKMLLTSTHR